MKQIPTTLGKRNSLLYAFFVSGFLFWQSISVSYGKDGLEIQTQDVPLPTVVACSTFIAIGLGVNILDALQTLINLSNRNSMLINSLAKKVNLEPDAISSTQEELQNNSENKDDSK